MDKTEVLIVGGGIVGLAAAEKLSAEGREVILVERHDGFGRESSSRNSEVIHAGLYYREGSLKACLCVKGGRMIYDFCEKEGIPYRKTGKIVTGITEEEVEKVHACFDLGNRNGAKDLRLLTEKERRDLEPELECAASFHSPHSGIFDTHRFMVRLEQKAVGGGAIFAYNCELTGLSRNGSEFLAEIRDADGRDIVMAADRVVNAAGLMSDRVAEMAGIDIDKAGYRIDPSKGEYFRLNDRYRRRVKTLVYPVETSRLEGEPNDGVHLVIGLDDSMKLGPNKLWGMPPDYDVDPIHRKGFWEEMSRYLPFLREEDLTPDTSGFRATLKEESSDFGDWIIRDESDRGLPGLIDLVGVQSPGVTSCLAIAVYVSDLINGRRP